MTHSRREFLKLTGLGVSGLALGACGSDDHLDSALVDNLNSTLDAATVRTRVAPMLLDVPDGPGFDVMPLLSAGDEVPLLSGSFPALTPSATLTYGLAGDPDGMGFAEIDGYYWVWLQHEVVGDSSDSDYRTTIFSRTIDGRVPGARISLLKLTKDWKVVGGMPLVREYRPTTILMQDDGETPRVAPGSKITIDTAAKTYTQQGYVASDFCGGMLAETGFVDPQTGMVAPVWLANEENGGYSGVAWACFPDGIAYPLEGFGIFEKETTVSLRRHRPHDVGHNIMIASEDDDDGRIYLWIGVPTGDDPNGFVNGQLYAMKIAGAARESGPGRFDGVPAGEPSAADGASVVGDVGASKACTWTAVPRAVIATRGGLGDFLSDASSGATPATAFLAPEDINEDLLVPERIWLAADGGAGSENYDDEGPRYENPLSRLYRIDLGIADPLSPSTWNTTITYVLEGGLGKGVSYDNLAPDSNGRILISEDWDQGSDEADAVWDVLKQEQRAPSLYLYDTSDGSIRLALTTNQADHDPTLGWDYLNELIAQGDEETARDDSSFWETSGMIEVPPENRGSRSAYLVNVQAHSLRPSGYEEGGQMLLVVPR